MIGTHRALPPSHPLYVLLMPHYLGTGFINYLSERTLVNPGGNVVSVSSLGTFFCVYFHKYYIDSVKGPSDQPGNPRA